MIKVRFLIWVSQLSNVLLQQNTLITQVSMRTSISLVPKESAGRDVVALVQTSPQAEANFRPLLLKDDGNLHRGMRENECQ